MIKKAYTVGEIREILKDMSDDHVIHHFMPDVGMYKNSINIQIIDSKHPDYNSLIRSLNFKTSGHNFLDIKKGSTIIVIK